MRSRRLTLVAIAATVPTLLFASAASADDVKPGSRAGGYVDQNDNPTAEATQTAANTGSGSGDEAAPSGPPCHWEYTSVGYGGADELVYEVQLGDGTMVQSPTGRWVMRKCDGLPSDLIVYPEGAAMPEMLALEALRSVAIPDPTVSTSPPAARLVVHVPAWLWIDGAWWTSYSASASAGAVTATVTAQPTRAVWSMGDGSTMTCAGPGTPWSPGMAEDASDCAHVYTAASTSQPDGSFQVSVTVEFAVSWTSNVGVSGTLGPISRSTSQPVRVGEIQAIETE